MIQKIGFNITTRSSINKGINRHQNLVSPPPSEKPEQEEAKPTTGLLHSYFVSFGAKTQRSSVNKSEIILNNLNDPAQELLDNAQKIAKKYGHPEVDRIHIIRAGLDYIDSFIDNLNSGEISYSDESAYDAYMFFENDMGKNIFKKKEKREILQPIIKQEKEILDKKLSKMSNAPTKTNSSNLPISKQYLNDVYSIYSQDNSSDIDGESGMGDGLVHDGTLFSAAMMPNSDTLKRDITLPFRNAIKDAIYIDKRPDNKRPHLKFYDEKAKNIWKNLAIGTNMVILHDKNTYPGYLVNSLLHLFKDSKEGFGNLGKKNTKILNLNDEGFIDSGYMATKLREFGKDKNNNYVVILDIMDDDLNNLAIDEYNIEIFKNAPQNVKFVMVANKDEYYKESTDEILQGFFTDFGEISLPLMNLEQAQKAFKETPELTEKIKKNFTRPALEKCIEAANQLSGNYPEKAQKVMELVSSYYVDKQNIGLSDVQNYIKEAKEIFKPMDNDNAVKVVFDTGIKLKDMVGAPATKKEAKSIVERIKDKSIGTKGFIIYSQDGSVGAGRKYTAQAIAGEVKAPYIEINAVDFGTKDVDLFGGGNLSPEASMKKLFNMVKAQAETNPKKSAVLFIENFEYFSFGENLSEYHEKAMSQLIREMNKAQEQGMNIVVMGSMGNPEYIGDATSKSFKFIDQIEVESPGYNKDARDEIINYYIKKKNIKLAGDATEQTKIKEHLNLLMERASYIEILTLLDKAKNVAKERKHKEIEKGDFTEAYLQLTTGRPSSAQDPYYRKELVTSHECGHALNATIMEELAEKTGNPSHKGTIVNFITLDPRGSFGGAVYTADSINPEYSFEHVFSDLVCDFGGNSCEKYFYGQDGSWGITCDMQMATHGASMASAIMGQGKHFGKKSMNGMWVLSEKDKDNINKDIDVMLTNAQLVSDAITKIYEDFNREFTRKYAPKVGTGECIVQREEFLKMLNEWREKQSPQKQKEFDLLDKTIQDVIAATKRGVKCYKEGE
ncbi:MAG: AAA family ATPase [Clostridium sp.]|nr:AAA family ATPase [Clostridium sp.]